jgi:hypothetical protein
MGLIKILFLRLRQSIQYLVTLLTIKFFSFLVEAKIKFTIQNKINWTQCNKYLYIAFIFLGWCHISTHWDSIGEIWFEARACHDMERRVGDFIFPYLLNLKLNLPHLCKVQQTERTKAFTRTESKNKILQDGQVSRILNSHFFLLLKFSHLTFHNFLYILLSFDLFTSLSALHCCCSCYKFTHVFHFDFLNYTN